VRDFAAILTVLFVMPVPAPAGDPPAWQPMLGDLVKTEKAGFGGLCGIAVDPSTGTLWINLSDRGFYRSEDQAATFKRASAQQPRGRTETPGCLLLDPTGRTRLLVTALVYGSPIGVSEDQGVRWKFMDARSAHVDWCAVNWMDPDRKFVLAMKHEAGGLLLLSRDGGASFTEVGKGFGPGWILDGQTAVVAQIATKDRLTARLLRTTDGGKSWQPCAAYRPVGVESTQALPRWQDGKLYWLVDGALIASADKGASWQRLAAVRDGRYGPVFGKSPRHLFLLTKAGIIESTDGGATWSNPIIPPPPAVKGIHGLTWLAYDQKNDVLYLMTMGSDLFKLERKRFAPTGQAAEPSPYANRAREVTEHIQKVFFDPQSGVYCRSVSVRKPDYAWRQSVMFSNLVAATRAEPARYGPLLQKYFTALDAYWDFKVKIPGYEPTPTRGNGNDKYYDDNAWLVITFLEAYETTGNARYLTRADETLKFVLSGWDEKGGGGIWWHQGHKDGTKNACSNGPAAVGCLRLAKFRKGEDAAALIEFARKIVAWTVNTLQADDGLVEDRVVVATGEVKRGKLTYNSALMLRALLGLYRATGQKEYLEQAQRIGNASDWFLRRKTGVYRDALQYAHFMVEADLELYRTTKEEYLLDRAKKNVEAYYASWKVKPPGDLTSNAAIARLLWLMAETETDAGRAFWQKADKMKK
jgi:hypothetical protein